LQGRLQMGTDVRLQVVRNSRANWLIQLAKAGDFGTTVSNSEGPFNDSA
jgi:hypothetical protein